MTGIGVVAWEGAVLGEPAAPAPRIEPLMSANAVVRAFPDTRRIFQRYGIDVGCEGCDCLDELAWRHGVDEAVLMEELRAAAHRPDDMALPCMGRDA